MLYLVDAAVRRRLRMWRLRMFATAPQDVISLSDSCQLVHHYPFVCVCVCVSLSTNWLMSPLSIMCVCVCLDQLTQPTDSCRHYPLCVCEPTNWLHYVCVSMCVCPCVCVDWLHCLTPLSTKWLMSPLCACVCVSPPTDACRHYAPTHVLWKWHESYIVSITCLCVHELTPLCTNWLHYAPTDAQRTTDVHRTVWSQLVDTHTHTRTHAHTHSPVDVSRSLCTISCPADVTWVIDSCHIASTSHIIDQVTHVLAAASTKSHSCVVGSSTRLYASHSCHIYVWVMSHVTYVYESCRINAWVMSRMSMSHVTYMYESCHIYVWVMSHICMSHVTYMHESCHIYAWVMSHICISHVAYMYESCHIYV